MNNPVYDYADDNHISVNFNCRENNNHCRNISDLSSIDDKTEVLYHSVGPSICQVTSRSETNLKANINEADMHAHCSIANSAANYEPEECHYEMENGRVS